MKNRWTNKEMEYLIDNYNKITIDNISKTLGKSYNSISSKAKRLGLQDKMADAWSKEEINILYQKYPYDKITDIIPLLNNRNKNSIMLKAKKLGLKKIIKNMDSNRKYVLNENYFENIDTPNKAYYLGWALTDGNVSIQGNSHKYRIRLNSIDENILIKFKKDIQSNSKIYTFGNCKEINLCSKKLVEDLAKYDCVPNKTKTFNFPSIENEFLLDFIKGCFDGDGSYICTNKTHKISYVSGSKNFIIYLRQILESFEIMSLFNDRKSYYTLEIGRKQSIRNFISLMLKTKSDFLDRKQDKMIELFNYVN